MKIIQAPTATDMSLAAKEILNQVQQRPTNGAVVIALSGDLGAGKTTLVQALAAHLGVVETVTSPTYVVMKTYAVGEVAGAKMAKPFSHLVHIDAYRIEDIDEMRVLKFPELLSQKDTMICIEWPEHIASLIPPDALTVSITVVGDGRELSLS